MARTGGGGGGGGGGSNKRTNKQTSIQPQNITTSNSSSSSSSTTFPTPFKPLPPTSTLHPFLLTLPTHHIYLLHHDTTTPSQKRSIFLFPILLNSILTLLLLWRAYHAVPVYFALLLSTLGYETPWTDENNQIASSEILGVISQRTGYLMMDYAIFGLVGRWPWEFVFGVPDAVPEGRENSAGTNGRGGRRQKAGAFAWRFNLGFKQDEVIVRRSRRWDASLPLGKLTQDGVEDRVRGSASSSTTAASEVPVVPALSAAQQFTREESLTAHMKVEAALRTVYTKKTAYLLLDKDWDLDFRGMIDIAELIRRKKVEGKKECDHVALMNVNGVWGVWYVHGDAVQDTAKQSESAVQDDEKLRLFKDKLTEMNCESVFYRWIEILQYETNRDGGFNEKRKAEAVNELTHLLRKRGRDEKELFDAVGGLGEVPGLEEVEKS